MASEASTRTIEGAVESVVQVRSSGRGAGAGVIWAGDGRILTNHHVVAGRRRGGRVQVVLHDGRTFDAEVTRRDRNLDLALLRVRGGPDSLPAAPVGDSDALRVGELVFAVGHPWGRPGVVTAGIVSGLSTIHGRTRYIQSDVSLAPGNSGGPLLNSAGRVVGINAMISGGMAFAIPSNTVSAWIAGAGERRPRLGVEILPVELPVALRREHRSGEMGFVVAAVKPGAPADRAGLLVGDILLGAAGEAGSLLDALSLAGDTLRLHVARSGVVFEVEVDTRSQGPGRAA